MPENKEQSTTDEITKQSHKVKRQTYAEIWQNLKQLKTLFPLSRSRNLPLTLIIGERLDNISDLALRHSSITGKPNGCYTFNEGIVINSAELCNTASLPLLFKSLLRLRPQRPVDSIIINVPLSKINTHESEIIQNAQSFKDIMVSAERITGMHVPIYLVISGSEAIPGITSIPLNQEQMLGWASGYQPNLMWQDSWIIEARDAITDALTIMRTGIFGSEFSRDTARNIFSANSIFKSTFSNLEKFTRTLFAYSIYHSPFDFRGIWFIATQNGQTLYFKSLLTKKIFPEHALAMPADRHYTARNTRMKLTQIAIICFFSIWLIGLCWGATRFNNNIKTITPFLKQYISVQHSMEKMLKLSESIWDETDVHKIKTDEKRLMGDTKELLNSLENFDDSYYHYFFSPLSYLIPAPQRLQNIISRCFKDIILKGMLLGLRQKEHNIYKAAKKETDNYQDTYTRLFTYLSELNDLSEIAGVFNELRSNPTINRFDIVSTNIFAVDFIEQLKPLGPILLANTTDYSKAVAPFRYKSKKIVERFNVILKLIYTQLYADNKLLQALADFNNELIALTSTKLTERRLQLTAYPDDQINSTLFNALSSVMQAAGDDKQNWILKFPNTVHTKKKGQLIALIKSNKYFSKTAIKRLNKIAQDMQKDIRAIFDDNYLNIQYGHNSFSILTLKDDDTYQISTMLNELHNLSKQLRGKTFFSQAPDHKLDFSHPGEVQLSWNLDTLKETATLLLSYKNFWTSDKLKLFPDIHTLSKYVMLKKLATEVNRSCEIYIPNLLELQGISENEQIINFNNSAPIIAEIISSFQKANDTDNATALQQFMQHKSLDILHILSSRLNKLGLYAPDSNYLAGWNNSGSIALWTLGLLSPADIEPYLDKTRRQLSQLCKPAHIALTFIPKEIVASARNNDIALWNEICSTLAAYNQKVKSNALSQLEDFIKFKLGSKHNDLTSPPLNWFHEKMLLLAQAADDQQKFISTREFNQLWNKAAKYFNSTLAPSQPFNPDATTAVTPRQLRIFFDLLPKIPDAMAQNTTISDFCSSTNFLREILEAENPLQIMLAAKFRANSRQEENMNSILDQTLDFGDSHLNYRGKDQSGTWHYGDGVTFSLIWAKDSNLMPLDNCSRKDIRVVGKKAIFSYPGSWGLLNFIYSNLFRKQKETELEFKVATSEARNEYKNPCPSATSGIRTFLDLTFSTVAAAGGKPQALNLPLSLPRKMPVLQE